jgi:hypothetical protein
MNRGCGRVEVSTGQLTVGLPNGPLLPICMCLASAWQRQHADITNVLDGPGLSLVYEPHCAAAS